MMTKKKYNRKGGISILKKTFDSMYNFLKTTEYADTKLKTYAQFLSAKKLAMDMMERTNFKTKYVLRTTDKLNKIDKFNNIRKMCAKLLRINLDEFFVKKQEGRKRGSLK